MAAVTGVITAVAGLGLSAYQMYEQSEAQKSAEAAADAAKNRLEKIEERNVMEEVQTPDISSLAFERIAQAEAQGLETLKGMGVEGAHQVTGMVEKGRQAGLQVAEKQAILEAQTDFQKAQVAQQIEGRRVDTERAIAYGELEGAQQAAADAEMGKQQATMNLVSGVGDLATGIGQATSLEAKARRQAKKNARESGDYLGELAQLYDTGAFDEEEGYWPYQSNLGM
jgi:hypothetical protein